MNAKTHIAELKTELKNQATATTAMRAEARTLSGRERYDAKAEANYGRDDRRHLHLAYCYLRGRTYNQCEQTCHEEPNVWAIANRAHCTDVTPDMGTLRKHIGLWIQQGNVTRFDLEGDGSEAIEKIKEAEDILHRAQAHADNTRKNAEQAVARQQAAEKALTEATEALAALKEVA